MSRSPIEPSARGLRMTILPQTSSCPGRAIRAFTRVFDALWREPGPRNTAIELWVPARAFGASGTRSKLTRSHRTQRELVADHLAALHHELHARELGDVGERIAGDRNQVSELALLQRADLVPR